MLNWYPPEVDALPLHLGRIACQRLNCWWESAQRRSYASGLAALVLLVLVFAFFVGQGIGMTLDALVLTVLAPLTPALVHTLRQYSEQLGASADLGRLRSHSDSLWKAAVSREIDPAAAEARSRRLQDEIFESRRRSPVIPDRIFSVLRPSLEKSMKLGIGELVVEAKRLGW